MKSILVFCVTTLLTGYISTEDKCIQTSSCSCKFSNGRVIDLSQLANNDNTPRFADEPDPVSDVDDYSWNPCNPFTEGQCQDVAVCNVHQNVPQSEYFPLGNQDSATFSTSGKVTKLTYIYQGTGGASRSAEITLTCDESQTDGFIVHGEDTPGSGKYFFELKTKYACTTSGISAGSVMLIVFFLLVVFYLALGIVFQIFVRKASGKERIPNYTFWVAVPGLIKDGSLFVFTCGKSKGYSSV